MNTFNYRLLLGPVLILVLLTCVALAARPLTPIDETRYISVAWEMWQKNDYLVMFKNGEPYSHKPPMLFWLYNLGWMAFGVNDWWPRLVSPLFSLGGLFLTLSIARRLWPEQSETHRNTLWILGSSLLWLVFSTSAMFDVMLAFLVLLGMRGLLIAVDESMKRGFVWLAIAIGFGVLAKGPVILLHLLPLAVLAPWWKPGMNWKRWYGAILLAVLGGAAIALAWAIPAAIRGGEAYRDAIFWGQTANRMVDSFAHRRPVWWYVPLLPVLLFPWLLWPALWSRFAALKREGLDRGLRFCLAWMVPVFVSFSFISGKQIHYLVPLFPAFALLSGRLLARDQKGGLWLPALAAGLIGAAMTYFAVAGLPDKLGSIDNLPWWPGIMLLVVAASTAVLGRKRHLGLPALAVLGALLFALVQMYISASAWQSYDVRPMANAIRQYQERGLTVANLGNYHAQYQFAGRLTRPVEQLGQKDLQIWLDKNPDGVLVVYVSRRQEPAEYLFSQPYRGETAVLLSNAQARLQLELLVKKSKKASLPEGDAE